MKTKKPVKRKVASRHRRARQSLRKRFLMHPATVFCLLLVGVLLASFTLRSKAATINITAEVPAPLITQPAVITNPKNGDVFSTRPIDVAGTCPNSSVIKLFRNGMFSGQVNCAGDDTFSLQSDLFNGANKLVASVFNITGEQGPDSSPVDITYAAPASPPAATASSVPKATTSQAAPNGFFISMTQPLKIYLAGQTVSLTLQPNGGVSPYAYNVKWGDSKEENIARDDSQPFTVNHAYRSGGQYLITINVTDALGRASFFQTNVAVAAGGKVTGFKFSGAISETWLQNLRSWLWVVWPFYLLIVLMVLSYLLGEREEFLTLRKAGRRRGRRPVRG